MNHIYIFLFLIIAGQCKAQSLDRQVISSFGEAVQQTNAGLSHTAGEVITASAVTSSVVLTQGFQQINDDELVGIFDPPGDQIFTKVFPNPATNELFITSNLYVQGIHTLEYHIIDVHGRMVMNGSIHSARALIDVRDLASATYTLILLRQDGTYIKRVPFIKVIQN